MIRRGLGADSVAVYVYRPFEGGPHLPFSESRKQATAILSVCAVVQPGFVDGAAAVAGTCNMVESSMGLGREHVLTLMTSFCSITAGFF